MSTTFNLKGTIHKIGEEKQFSEKFKKREMVLFVKNEQNEQYSDYINFEFTQDGCNMLNKVEVGDEVNVKFGINGREYQGRYFNNLRCFNMDKTDETGKTYEVTNELPDVGTKNNEPSYSSAPPEDEGDSLPF